jgi:hypothetical protein
MPQPYRRSTIEGELSAIQLQALAEDCMIFGIPRNGWQHVPALRVKYESTAVASSALKIMQGENRAWTDALLRACVSLDVSYEAARKRLGGWRRVGRLLPPCREDGSGTLSPGSEVVAGPR